MISIDDRQEVLFLPFDIPQRHLRRLYTRFISKNEGSVV